VITPWAHQQPLKPMSTRSLDADPLVAAQRRELALYAVAALVFTASATITWYSSQTMSAGMAMPGGWTMSMAWMPMGSWAESALMFAGMWVAMMIAMMLPSILPMLLLYRRVLRFRGEAHAGILSAVMAIGYFATWTTFGIVAYMAGFGITQLAMRSGVFSRAVPIASGLALLAGGVYQLTPWKAACLKHCRDPLSLVAAQVGGSRGALRLGIHHGAFCAACCWALMLIQLVLGVMNIAVMIAVALVIALEKLLHGGMSVARATGVLAMAGGAIIAGRALFS
jgi:predicted metal-binding membrane protein